MAIVGGLDIHRKQLTFDYLDQASGEVVCGRICPADREHLAEWLQRFAGVDRVCFAVEACTGWRYVVECLQAARGSGAAGRAGRYRGRSGAEEAGQDRPYRLPAAARARRGRPGPAVLDPSTAGPGVPGAAGAVPRSAP